MTITLLLNIIKNQPNNYQAYYNLALLNPEKAEYYLKKALSFNVNFASGYEKLCDIYIDREYFNMARNYINNLQYIDENDFKYYYYQSKIESAMGNTDKADFFLEECEKAEPNYRDKINKDL